MSLIYAILGVYSFVFVVVVWTRIGYLITLQLMIFRRGNAKRIVKVALGLVRVDNVYRWLLPIAPAAYLARGLIGRYLDEPLSSSVSDLVCAGLWYFVWRMGGKDDRWKKLRKKLKEKVSVNMNGRLVVQPSA